ncbi:MAG TPA: DUF6625 family protein [Balneolales bacterium]|nr:DUF6625 family protein [Balneolales bacterium]
MSSTKKIVILICYYGKFPWYFPYFLHSCSYNPSIEFIIISENCYDQELPKNVTIIKMSWEQIKKVIRKRLGFQVQIEVPYKLCDFKPAYGLIFPELIKGFDFWGHGDIDVIFGQIRNFITNKVLSTHDLISVRHDVLTGYFTLYRNSMKMNELFMQSKDYKKVFLSSKHYCFDETNFAFEAFKKGLPPEKVPSEIESMTHVVKKLHKKNYIKAYFDFHVIEGYPGKLKWERGTLTYKNEYEIILYHLVRFKKICIQTRLKKIPDAFHISPTRIYI